MANKNTCLGGFSSAEGGGMDKVGRKWERDTSRDQRLDSVQISTVNPQLQLMQIFGGFLTAARQENLRRPLVAEGREVFFFTPKESASVPAYAHMCHCWDKLQRTESGSSDSFRQASTPQGKGNSAEAVTRDPTQDSWVVTHRVITTFTGRNLIVTPLGAALEALSTRAASSEQYDTTGITA